MISVIIPSYKSPQYLDLALWSARTHQHGRNQIIAIIDGSPEMYEVMLKNHPGVQVLINEENKGQTYCHNMGVTLAEHDQILIVNDDNVFPCDWDKSLEYAYDHNERVVIAPNQIEPVPSIFKSFIIEDLGKTPENFRLHDFSTFANTHDATHFADETLFGQDGQTWPLCMSKKWYMILGGIDPNFPSPAVADWDFFMRCEMAGLACKRYFGAHFYHFASAATKKTPEMVHSHQQKEQQSYEYFQFKWGFAPRLNEINSKLNGEVARGLRFSLDG